MSLRLMCLLGMASTAWITAAAAGPMEEATSAYMRGENAKAVKILRPLAEAGNRDAQFYLGGMYDYGLGVTKDYEQAIAWYGKAAAQGVTQAQVNLAFKYQTGQGVKQNLSEALRWYHVAADKGNALAQFNLGTISYDGPGGEHDYGEAAKWFLLAAAQGNAVAQFNLGRMFNEGLGVTRDTVQAYKWWDLAANRLPTSEILKRTAASKSRDILGHEMMPAELARARKLAQDWKPKNS